MNIFIVTCFIVIILILIFIWMALKYLMKGDCKDVDVFKGDGTIYEKSINLPTIGTVSGNLTFSKDGTFIVEGSLEGNEKTTFTGNTWIYVKDTCELAITLSEEIVKQLPEIIEIDNSIQLTVNGGIKISVVAAGVLPLVIEANPNKAEKLN